MKMRQSVIILKVIHKGKIQNIQIIKKSIDIEHKEKLKLQKLMSRFERFILIQRKKASKFK